MGESGIAEKLVEVLHRPDGDRALRPVHTIGIGATGYFKPSPIARNFCIAQHFREKRTNVSVRFSNGSGAATAHDGWSDVRGLAVRFHLSDGSDTDLIAMTLPEFFSPTPEDFLNFAEGAKPKPYKGETPWQKIFNLLQVILPKRDPYPGETISPDEGAIEFADQNPHAQLAVLDAAEIGAPVSYVRESYHAVHTFVVTGADKTRRWVRFSWQPIAGVLKTNPNLPPVDDYLRQELKGRLASEPARFSLMMAVGEVGDDFNNSSRPWPPHRKRIMMGTLTVNAVPEDQIEHSEKLSFNPGLLTEGIETSEDPVLKIRIDSYKISSERRSATPCPFSQG
ncbi:catalase [Rhodobacteraceae bacterium B1Z28]|uniref:catalase n=1 Tax=Ruegeria haliotis TaxID=2747601 RepID=A0ABX2PXJ4_9RHOB|nr:catalase [Ruegeria haliotis]NVO57812.1 catalase [Ruegeria haliotis]